MANMSYCRFQNTAPDLRDCADHLLDDDLSKDEREALKRLIKTCREIVSEWEENGND